MYFIKGVISMIDSAKRTVATTHPPVTSKGRSAVEHSPIIKDFF